jgi:hypothetical protein
MPSGTTRAGIIGTGCTGKKPASLKASARRLRQGSTGGLVGSRQARKTPAAMFQPRTVQPLATVAPQVKKTNPMKRTLPSLRKHITPRPIHPPTFETTPRLKI